MFLYQYLIKHISILKNILKPLHANALLTLQMSILEIYLYNSMIDSYYKEKLSFL